MDKWINCVSEPIVIMVLPWQINVTINCFVRNLGDLPVLIRMSHVACEPYCLNQPENDEFKKMFVKVQELKEPRHVTMQLHLILSIIFYFRH